MNQISNCQKKKFLFMNDLCVKINTCFDLNDEKRKAHVLRKLYIIIESLSHDYMHYEISKRNYYDLTCTINITVLHGILNCTLRRH